jgi:hypothetical protein
VPEERLAREPQQDRAVLADRPEHSEIAERGIGFAQDVNAAVFQLIELVHVRSSACELIVIGRASQHKG